MSNLNSREHHWWPIGIQKEWQDSNGDVHWLEPNGKSCKKKYYNEKIAKKAHGHTVFIGDPWGDVRFEPLFDHADNSIGKLLEELRKKEFLGEKFSDWRKIILGVLNENKSIRDLCKYGFLTEDFVRILLEITASLAIRSPANRDKYENIPSAFGRDPSSDIGKLNMHSQVMALKKILDWHISNYFVVLLRDKKGRFQFGDGIYDHITGGLFSGQLRGRLYLALTPKLSIFICKPLRMRGDVNFATIDAPKWMIDNLNQVTQVYSKRHIFYNGKVPNLSEHFRIGEFLQFTEGIDPTIDLLLEISGNRPDRSLFGSFNSISMSE